jgi:hypothetical protein
MERQGRLMSIKEQIRRDEYEVDVEAVARAILRRIVAASRRAHTSDDVFVAAEIGFLSGQNHA